MAVTMKDIANAVGVSVNAVSMALKDKPEISLKTRQRIKNVAQAMGYRPNLNARSLVLQKTSTIGLAVTESNNPVRMEFCQKLRNKLESDGYHLLMVSIQQNWTEKNRDVIEELLARRVDGLIIGTVWDGPEKFMLEDILKECHQDQIPVVLLGKSSTQLADCVNIDFQESIYKLTEHLIAQGYREISYGAACGSGDKFLGYQQAMLENNLKQYIHGIDIYSGEMFSAYTEINEYLNSGQHLPKALIAVNDLGALGILAALREHNIRVPEDCAVCGVDNIAYGNFSAPPLTSIGFDNGDCAQAVWNLMLRRLNKVETRAAVQIKVDQKLIVRKSS